MANSRLPFSSSAIAVLPIAVAEEALPGTGRRGFDARLGAAFAASFAVHVGTLAVLVAGGAGAGTGAWSLARGLSSPLEVVLATAGAAAERQPADHLLAASAAAALRVPPPQSPAATPASARRTGTFGRQTEPARASGSRQPRVVVDARVPRTRFADALESGPLAQFPLEIETPVALPGSLQVPYPPSALEAQREGSVLVWAIVDTEGGVEEMRVVDGASDFAAAVTSTLAQMRFIPARDGGVPIRFYVTLAFDFRLAPRGDATTAAR